MMPTPTITADEKQSQGRENLRSPWTLVRGSADQPNRTVRIEAPFDSFHAAGGVEPYLRCLERWRALAHPVFVPLEEVRVEQGVVSLKLPFFPIEALVSRLPGPLGTEGAAAVGILLEQLASGLEVLHAAGLAHGSVAADWVIWKHPQAWLLPPAIESIRSSADQGPDLQADLTAWAQLAGELLSAETGKGIDPRGKWRAIRERTVGQGSGRRIRTAAELARAARRLETETALSDRLADDPLPPEDTILTLSVLLRATARLQASGPREPVLSPDAITILPDGDVRLEPATPGADGAAHLLSDPQYACPDLFHVAAAELDRAKVAIYSIGFLFYELLLGRVRFQQEIEVDRAAGDAFWYGWHADRAKRTRRLDAVIPGFPVAVASRIESMIEKDPARRAGSLDALAGQFQRLALPTADYHARPVAEIGPRFVRAARQGWVGHLRRTVSAPFQQTRLNTKTRRND